MKNLNIIDLLLLEITPSLTKEGHLRLVGAKTVLTADLVERIRCNKAALIQELTNKCEHVNVVNKISSLNNLQEDNSLPLTNVQSQINSLIIPVDPIEDLDITLCNRNWIEKQLAFKTQQQRFALLTEYRNRYMEAANVIPSELSHMKANAGTSSGNIWLRETLDSMISFKRKYLETFS